MLNFKLKSNKLTVIHGIFYILGVLSIIFLFGRLFYLLQFTFFLSLILFIYSLFSNSTFGWASFLIFIKYCFILTYVNFLQISFYFIPKYPELFFLAGFGFFLALFQNVGIPFTSSSQFKRMKLKNKLKMFYSFFPTLSLYFICIQIILKNNLKILNNDALSALITILMCIIIIFYQSKSFKFFINTLNDITRQINTQNNLLQKISVVLITYTGISIIYSFIYSLLNKFDPKSFNVSIDSWFDYFYFSTITVATVGYGDIFPKSNTAKFFVMSEIYFGIIVLTIFLSIAISTALDSKGKDSK